MPGGVGARQAGGPRVPGGRLPGTDGGPRHCWVVDSHLAPGRCPGVLLEWQQTPQGWRGRVVLAIAGDGGPVLMEAWLPAGLLRPVIEDQARR